MKADSAPQFVRDAAKRRSEARVARDWATADQLRAEIEGAGWRVIDTGTDYQLEPASAPDLEIGGEIRYGRSEAVPSRLEEPATGLATLVLPLDAGDPGAAASLSAIAGHAPAGVDLVVVADGTTNAMVGGVRDALEASPLSDDRRELVRMTAPLGRAAALNVGIRRARAPIIVVIDASIEPTGDVVTPLVSALDDPSVAVAGPFGLVSVDLRRFEDLPDTGSRPADAAAIAGYLMAFRRADAIARGPMDEAFRFYRNLDLWWSLVLRDEGEDQRPRRALAVPGLPLQRREPHAWTSTADAERERLSRRNFYRILDRFRSRLDLVVPPG